MMSRFASLLLLLTAAELIVADESHSPDRVELIPLPDDQVSMQIDGVEKTRWHFGRQYPRPFFFPFSGPSGASLTRMGHPGAPNHDHHRSVWIAHHDVGGHDFWSDGKGTQVVQRQWYCYSDGDQEGVMAVWCDWIDPKGKQSMEQDLIAALRPLPDGEHALEFQITLRPAGGAKAVNFGRTNFGFLAVRVAKTISVHFGGGQLTSSAGQTGEAATFGNQARWMDYSGPVIVGNGPQRNAVVEGITYFDHPENPRYPTRWHVREDGWMGASFCMQEAFTAMRESPLTLRYLLHAHAGRYDPARAQSLHQSFVARPGFSVGRAAQPHLQFEVKRKNLP